jgi:PPP family 3-phenylpropionic acid transporter
MSMLFAAIYLSVGIHLPYFPLWLDHIGFGAEEIAVILAAPMFLRMATTPLITAYADRASDRANVMIFVAGTAVLLSLGYFLSPSYAVILTVSVLLAVVWAPQGPLADSLALSGVRRYGSNYAKMRIWGSSSFLVANVAGGMLLSVTGVQMVPALMTAGLVSCLAATFFIPRLGKPRVASPLSASTLQNKGPGLFTPKLLWVVAGAGLITSSHGFVYGFGSIYWTALGIGEKTVGLLWALGVLAEVVMFLVFTRLFGAMSPIRILILAGIGALMRWVTFPLIWSSGFGVSGFVLSQTLHAASTGLVLLGIQKMVAETVADHRLGAAQGLVYFANGITMATVTLASGPLYAFAGANGFYVMAAIAMFGIIALVMGNRSTPESHRRG